MNEEEQKKKELEEMGHNATKEELEALEPGTPTETPIETGMPEEREEIGDNLWSGTETE